MDNIKKTLTIIFVFIAMTSFSQKINRSLFKNTSWFTSNDKNSFFINDTVKLIKHNSCFVAYDIKDYCEDEEKTIGNKRHANPKKTELENACEMILKL